MKKLKLTKVMASTLIVASILALNPIGASAEWRQDSTGWWYAEGSSYCKGWKEIDGGWYYFNSEGYMDHDKIVDGYYLNNKGVWSNGGVELKSYAEILQSKQLMRKYNIQCDNPLTLFNNVIDIDQDGTFEMIITHGNSMGSLTISIFTYKDGNIQVEHIPFGHGWYVGYNSDRKEFIINAQTQGNIWGAGYKLENNKCIKVDSWDCHNNGLGESYKLNGTNISQDEFDEFIAKFN
ncbi:hypothetical protein CBE01nite_34470 [Clostridium beijerinckii]|uniref:Cell wall-binding protein n=1 Tax=Clostridium beijerinckii TaxID=1520 RepID=A0AB74VFM7_CLOBE|nr:hypothetical protein [Clostridium beijerinckii]NRZ24360.1 hypothetical protein [Clostridium beijerinckii]NYB99421.1 hypothetical protein [Clostridium beijerinckii]OOM21572.1 putative cell wall binding repeat protein [Clostridium beijerinckii]QUN35197.1 hypothetical protein KEC93_25420 [Clostridium beijerinckii]SQB20274.1 cell wall binding repeat-containing protein [Clostridium beijerinckii]